MADTTSSLTVQALAWGIHHLDVSNSQVLIHKNVDPVLLCLARAVYNLCCFVVIPPIGMLVHGFKTGQTLLQSNTDHTWKHLKSFAIDTGCALCIALAVHYAVAGDIFNLVHLLVAPVAYSIVVAVFPVVLKN